MSTFLATLAVFVAALLAMGIGLLLRGRSLKGSCGGGGEACVCSPLAARSCPIRRAREAARASGCATVRAEARKELP